MPLVEYDGLGFTQYDPRPEEQAPVGSPWGAAFRLENDVAAMVDLTSRPVFQPTEGFDLGKELKARNLWEDRDHYLGARSNEELDYRSRRLAQERQDRDTLERSGWAGVGAAMVAGVLSPVSLIPLTAGGRGLRAFSEGLALGTAAGGLQELPLQLSQEERTGGETAFAIGASAVLGGIFGGAAGMMRKTEVDKVIAEYERGIDRVTVNGPIPSSVGAAGAVPAEAGRLARKGPISGMAIDQLAKVSPPARVLNSTSPEARWMMSQLSDSGLGLERNVEGIPTALGGTAEQRIKTWSANYWEGALKIDEAYADLQFNGAPPKVLPGLRAQIGGKMSKSEFRAEIARAMFNGDEHEIVQIRDTARFLRQKLWDPLYDEAVRVGIFNGNETALSDPTHMLRMYNTRMIEARRPEFVGKLADHYERKLLDEFTSARENFDESEKKFAEYLEDIRRPPEEVKATQEQLKGDLQALEEGRGLRRVQGVPLDEYEDAIRELRRQASLARKAGDNMRRKSLLEDARAMEAAGGETLAALKGQRAAIKRRLRNLTRSEASLGERHAKKLEKIEALEEANVKTLRQAIRSGQRVQRELDKWSDKRLNAELSKLRNEFERVAAQYDKVEARIAKLVDKDDPDFKILALGEDAGAKADKLTAISEMIGAAEDLDRDFIRAAINEALDESLAVLARRMSKRAFREERLMAQAAKLTPEALEAHVGAKRAKLAERVLRTEESFRARGADEVDLRKGIANFSRYAKETAEATTENILGTYLRLPAVDILQQERGSELARVLDIPTKEIWDFVEQDIEKLIRAHLRTMAPDIEIMDKLRVRGADSFDWRNMVRPIVEERNRIIDDINAEEISDAAKEKKILKVTDKYAGHMRDIEATISRLRHTWGIPQEPNGIATRAGRLMMNLNVLRLMGTVSISSIPDVARPVMKYGLLRTFRDGFVPLITNFQAMKLSAREVKLAGAALDPVLHTRAAALFDVLDDLGRTSKFERGVEYLSHRQGVVALFDYWTSAMKQFTGVVANAELLDSVRLVVEGGSKREVKRATEYLARNGIDGNMAADIWRETTQAGGGNRVNGVWWPNTEAWKDPATVRAYRAALVREVDNAIITPGVERPLWTNSTMLGRIISQFQSFAFSSTTKTLAAGLQEDTAKVLVGMNISLAFGALSYYLWALSVGGDALKQANKFDPAKYADEAITRSGLLGIGDIGQRILERIPATAPYATFSGQRTTRRGGDELLGALGGPSLDLLDNVSNVLMGADEPTQATANSARRLLPWQNVFYIRQGYDQVIDAFELPESRK